jgi:hypothetical protein
MWSARGRSVGQARGGGAGARIMPVWSARHSGSQTCTPALAMRSPVLGQAPRGQSPTLGPGAGLEQCPRALARVRALPDAKSGIVSRAGPCALGMRVLLHGASNKDPPVSGGLPKAESPPKSLGADGLG